MADDAKIIRRYLRNMEKEVGLVHELRGYSKTDGGRLTDFGKSFVRLSRDSGLKQAWVARLLGITPGAVSQHYNR